MEDKLNMAQLSKEDELSVRKAYVEKMLKECKKQTEDKVMMLLAGVLDKDVESKAKGQVVFLERWLNDIDEEIKNL
jgi:hypothetical protein